ncbi:hypothetical protein Pmani_005535 [Petrolisthes manimaculis]|uniref:Uncharacterized protein n=1 Tax=Petrolisthes manimaculis TaxID=1843537 RepID=A0AAE1UHE4_9EUCA|nr:hypothetical protein Pmani_005535 [Petrolisthes manimaculis]
METNDEGGDERGKGRGIWRVKNGVTESDRVECGWGMGWRRGMCGSDGRGMQEKDERGMKGRDGREGWQRDEGERWERDAGE